MINISRSFLIEFNNKFPLDREYRKKHGIPLFSEQHRNISQVDIYLEWLEDELFSEHELDMKERNRKADLYKKGEWMEKREEIEKNLDELFDKLEF